MRNALGFAVNLKWAAMSVSLNGANRFIPDWIRINVVFFSGHYLNAAIF
jgi:hypothetical protein